MDNKQNQFAAYKQWWLYKRIYKEKKLREQFIDAGKLKREAVAVYQRHVERFQELL